jgi:hypothetical protein
MSERPTGPEDPTPGPAVTLSRDQFDALLDFVPRTHLSVRLRNRGAAYIEAELLDPEGNVTKHQLLFQLYPKKPSWQAYRRWLRRRDEEEGWPTG